MLRVSFFLFWSSWVDALTGQPNRKNKNTLSIRKVQYNTRYNINLFIYTTSKMEGKRKKKLSKLPKYCFILLCAPYLHVTKKWWLQEHIDELYQEAKGTKAWQALAKGLLDLNSSWNKYVFFLLAIHCHKLLFPGFWFVSITKKVPWKLS